MQSLTREEFVDDYIIHAAAERSFQVAIQAVLDIGNIILAENSVTVAETYAEICLGLADIGVFPLDFAQRLVGMSKFRNVLVHLYLSVDLAKMYHYIQNDLGDFDLFSQYVAEHLVKPPLNQDV